MQILVNNKDISKLVTSLSISSSIENLATTIDLAVVYYENTNFFAAVVVGDKLEIDNIFKGIVVDVSKSTNNLSVKAFDIAFYLNQNKILKQVRYTKGKQAIQDVCSSIGLDVSIKGLNTTINKLYKNVSVAEFINDIIALDNEQTGKEYYIYAKDNTIYIDFLGNLSVNPFLKTKNGDLITNEQITENIEELKNSIIVTTNDSESIQQLSKAEDSSSISKYGKLQEVVEVSADNSQSYTSIANQVLKNKNVIKKTITIEFISNVYAIAGNKLKYNNIDYIIKSVNASIENGLYKYNMELREV